ncbi:hypothetical protein L6164_005904 [Bauhinia variegata]|uniref:Uncharacterized protein n=1 Tax=Bauhinia variegata TaxID=167791 RepID=A0ACB9PSK2_BAUVA|nr:hypothetical protein L6164_005904 [Bauhinia variegata]
MFYLSRIEHTLALPSYLLSLPMQEAIHKEIEKLFLDKVIANLGLCISVYDIRSIEGVFVFPSVGAPTYTIVMLNLFLAVTLGFFDDIYVPGHQLPNPSHFEGEPNNSKRVTWFWDYNEQSYPIDKTEEIKFRVQSVSFLPIPVEQPKDSKPFAPMLITEGH